MAQLELWLPSGLLDVEERRRARILLGFCALVLLAVAITLPLNVLIGAHRAVAFSPLLALAALVVPLLVRRQQTMAAGLVLNVCVFVIVEYIAATRGGLDSTTLGWSPVCVVVGTLTLSTRGAKLMAVLWAVSHFAHAWRVDPAHWDALRLGPPFAYALPRALGCLVTLGLVSVFETARRKATAALWQEQDHIRRQRDEIAAVNDLLAVRNGELRLVLDSIEQGLLVLNERGVVLPEHSAALEAWFGPVVQGETFLQLLQRSDRRAAESFECAWMMIEDGFMPLEVVLGQMPARARCGEKSLGLRYSPLQSAEQGLRIMVVITDLTPSIEQARVTARERETLALFGHFMKDRRAFHSFLDETQKLVTRATAAVPEGDLRLTLHTLKGNAAVFGLEGLSALADDLEEELLVGGNLSPDAREELSRAWGLVCSRAQSWLQEASGRIEVRQRDIDALERAISAGASPEKLKRLISEWGLQDAAVRLERLRSRAMRVAQRLGKENLRVELRGEEVRLETNEFEEFWATFTHVVNNAVDHGQEPREQRLARGKDPIWTLRLEVRETPTEVCVCAWDDGSGIDWERLRSKATARGIAIPKEDPPTELLFEAGLSSRDAASEISGRGVGMAAVKEAVAALGGYVQVESEGGRYTQIACHLPRPKLGAFTHRPHHA